ncbi:MAG: hypothetical protein JSV96_15390 [Candidatus Aminicenantes bacterium]|nr:MAG: hypothetical protein JSV96_15390 [Candidatus Aminicenantes bacterium]
MTPKARSKIRLSESEAQNIEGVYDGFLEEVKKLSDSGDVKKLRQKINDLIDIIFKRLSSEGESILLYTSKFFEKDYIFAHALNVSLLSMRIGQRLGIDREGLRTLGFLALTHAWEDMGLPEELVEGIKQDKDMDEIMRLANVYDSLTNPPAYRHALTPCETMESIVKSNEFFEHRLVRILVDELSFYPPGCWVQLSDKAMGRVIKANLGQPLRPVVKIFIDWEGNYLREGQLIDLSQRHSIHISRPLTEEEIKKIKDNPDFPNRALENL